IADAVLAPDPDLEPAARRTAPLGYLQTGYPPRQGGQWVAHGLAGNGLSIDPGNTARALAVGYGIVARVDLDFLEDAFIGFERDGYPLFRCLKRHFLRLIPKM